MILGKEGSQKSDSVCKFKLGSVMVSCQLAQTRTKSNFLSTLGSVLDFFQDLACILFKNCRLSPQNKLGLFYPSKNDCGKIWSLLSTNFMTDQRNPELKPTKILS